MKQTLGAAKIHRMRLGYELESATTEGDMRETFTASTWGTMGLGQIRVAHDHESGVGKADSVARSCERRLGLAVACGPTSDGYVQDRHGRCVERHYRMTMGKPLRTGGYSVEGEVWFSVPAGQ